ncbi:MAG: hypothetical protein WA324_09555 [Bryobacteraceae bacterium]
MKILFDNGTPAPIAGSLVGHTVTRARQIGWETLKNGDLIQQAEDAGYDLLLSTDKNPTPARLETPQNCDSRAGRSAMAGRAAVLGSDRCGDQRS